MKTSCTSTDKYTVLQDYFGYTTFRKGQEPIVDALLNGQDVLGVMPTGAGKRKSHLLPMTSVGQAISGSKSS